MVGPDSRPATCQCANHGVWGVVLPAQVDLGTLTEEVDEQGGTACVTIDKGNVLWEPCRDTVLLGDHVGC